MDDVIARGGEYLNPRRECRSAGNPWPLLQQLRRDTPNEWSQATWLPDGRRLHLNHGPIDLIVEAFGDPDEKRLSLRAGSEAV